MKIEDIVVLVGGRGTRLGKITKKIPKPLIKVNNKPFLENLFAKLLKFWYSLILSFKPKK